jgi:hypothetical protein
MSDSGAVAVRETQPIEKIPKANTISEFHIEAAYVYGSLFQQKRIDLYGLSNVKELADIGKPTGKVDVRGPNRS